jgi:hypothetical protein
MNHRVIVAVRRLVVDRTFRFYAPRTDFLRECVKLDALPGSNYSFYAPGVNLRQLEAISSHRHVVLNTKCSNTARGEQDHVVIKAKSAARAAHSETFYITLYTDSLQAVPTETWQVSSFVIYGHSGIHPNASDLAFLPHCRCTTALYLVDPSMVTSTSILPYMYCVPRTLLSSTQVPSSLRTLRCKIQAIPQLSLC